MPNGTISLSHGALEAPRETLRLNQGVLRHVYWDTYQAWKREEDAERKLRMAGVIANLAKIRHQSVELVLTMLHGPIDVVRPSASVIQDAAPVAQVEVAPVIQPAESSN